MCFVECYVAQLRLILDISRQRQMGIRESYIITDQLLVAAIVATILQRKDSKLEPDAKDFLMRRANKLNIIRAD